MCVFVVMQKTADEMRISDWSSDVCSSDLHDPVARRPDRAGARHRRRRRARAPHSLRPAAPAAVPDFHRRPFPAAFARATSVLHAARSGHRSSAHGRGVDGSRSEEHTFELQPLMRISYAVFCLKQKTYLTYTSKYLTTTTKKTYI